MTSSLRGAPPPKKNPGSAPELNLIEVQFKMSLTDYVYVLELVLAVVDQGYVVQVVVLFL